MTRERLTTQYHRFGAPGLAVLALLVLLATLYGGGETVGLSDNGDFFRVMDAASLAGAQGGTFRYGAEITIDTAADTFWGRLGEVLFTDRGLSHYPSVHVAFVRVSVAVNLVLNALTGAPAETYRIAVLGIMYALCWSAALLALCSAVRLPRVWADLAAKGLVLLVFCDVGYTAYFHSFYGEPLQTVGLLLMAAFGLRAVLRPERRERNFLFFCLSAVLYGWAKFANLPAAMLLTAGLAVAAGWKQERRRQAALALTAAVSIALLAGIYLTVPGWMDRQTTFNSVFFGMLKDTDETTQREVLADLGLPEEMAAYAGTNYYTQRAAPFKENEAQQQALASVSKFDLLFAYLRRPALLLEKLDVSMAHCGSIRPFYLDNLGGDPRPTLTDRAALWSALRHRLPFDTWGWTALLLAGSAACVFLTLGSTRRVQSAVLCAAVAGALFYHLLIPMVSNGEGDLMKHLFAFGQGMDLLFLLCCAGVLTAACRARRWGALALPGLCAVLAAAVLLPGLVSGVRVALTPEETAQPGSRWTLGGLQWQVAETDGSTVTLVAAEPVTWAPFDPGVTSRWSGSALRGWLNTAFLERFTAEERALLAEQTHAVPLARTELAAAGHGDDELYCVPVQRLCDRGLDRAYGETVTDLVTLPDLGLVGRMSRGGLALTGDCWLESPYYGASGMVRYLASDGLVLFQTSDALHGVRPVIRVRLGE